MFKKRSPSVLYVYSFLIWQPRYQETRVSPITKTYQQFLELSKVDYYKHMDFVHFIV